MGMTCKAAAVFPDPEIEAQLATAPGQVSLEGWDTASVLTMDAMNTVVQGQKIKLPELNAHNKFSGTITDGIWDNWDMFPDKHFVGGAVRMCCTLKSGKATDVLGGKYNLAGAKVYITVTIKTVKTPAIKLTDATADPSVPGEVHSLLVQDKAQNHIDAVTVDKVEPQNLSQPFKTMIAGWFNDNITSFNPVFHSALLNEKAAHGAFQWVKPTLLSYASLTDFGGDGYFGALCKTDKKNASWAKLSNQIDSAIADQWPKGVNSIFAISAERFVQQFMLRGAVHMFKDAKESDFDVKGDNLVVTNNKMLTWGDFKLEDGTAVSPTIPKGGLIMTVIEDKLQAQFTGITWEHPLLVGSDVFTLNFTQNVMLRLGKNKKGEPVLMTTNDYKGQKKKKEVPYVERPHISAKPDRAAVDFDRWTQIIGMALSVLSLGTYAVGKWAVDAAEAVETANSVKNWIQGSADVLDVVVDGESALDNVSQAAANTDNLAAAAAFTGASRTVPLVKTAPYLLRFSKIAGFMSLLTLGTMALQKIMMDSDMGFDPDTMPPLNNFMDNVLGAEAWPGVKGAELKHVRLAESLLLYFNRTM